LRARALIYAGRPDPEWPIDAGRAAAIVGLLEAAPVTGAAAPAPPALGYRGVRVASEAGVSWEVHAGVIVEARPRSAPVRRLDPRRRVEKAVLATAPPGTLPIPWLEGLIDPQ
jgi:hypothetical protein